MEATIAIMIFSSVLLFIYVNQNNETDISDGVYSIQKRFLDEVSLNEELRSKVLVEDEDYLNDFAQSYFPGYLNYSIEICNLTEQSHVCNLELNNYNLLLDKNIYVQETIISANLTNYSPKIIRVFAWEA